MSVDREDVFDLFLLLDCDELVTANDDDDDDELDDAEDDEDTDDKDEDSDSLN
jgi:hypothetical protein